ncbi:YeiH family protein [Sulfitobacter sp.]|uniref:YeiH family protein n=1 Tax=Sulfitobacter sp. TaxID=1903071 RepID=UPI003002D3C8
MHTFSISIGLSNVRSLFPGFLISALIALAAQFISEHYGAPAMLMALLFGIALSFLSDDPHCETGIAFSARSVLRFGVALLGMRISFNMAADLGWAIVCLVIGGVIATILFGLLIARLFGHGSRFAFLSAGSVAICGASAAMAISAILPRDDRTEERLVFTVVGVTILSTFAMIVYPILADALGYDAKTAGIFLGATIHDVAQVVGAGFSISEDTGDVATVVKLIRVAMLAPVILVASIIIRRVSMTDQDSAKRPPLIPAFVAAFAILVALNSFGFFPSSLTTLAAEISRWALLTAIAAVGMKTALKEVINVGLPAISLLVVETTFIGCLTVAALYWMV